MDEQGRRLTAAVAGGVDSLEQVLRELKKSGVTIVEAGLRRPTLDDVFLTLTGHAAEVDESPGEDGKQDTEKTKAREKEAVR